MGKGSIGAPGGVDERNIRSNHPPGKSTLTLASGSCKLHSSIQVRNNVLHTYKQLAELLLFVSTGLYSGSWKAGFVTALEMNNYEYRLYETISIVTVFCLLNDVLRPSQSLWDLWRIKWHWDMIFSEFFGSPVSIIPPLLTTLIHHLGDG
jgi:hypothetical protein